MKRYDITRFLHTKHVMRTSGIIAMPHSILRFSIWIYNLVFATHVQTNSMPACLPAFFPTLFVSDNLWPLLYSFRIVVSVIISIEQNKRKEKASSHFLVGAWSTTCQKVTSQYIPVCINIERGMARLPLRQHLGWPSSYTVVCTVGSLSTEAKI